MKKIIHITKNRLIIFIYLLLFLLLGIISIKGIYSQRQINKLYNYIIDSTVSELRLLRQTRREAEKIQTIVIDEVFHPTFNTRGDLNTRLHECEANLYKVRRHASDKDRRILVNKMLTAWQDHRRSLDTFLKLRSDEDKAIAYYKSTEKVNWDSFIIIQISFLIQYMME